VKKKTGPKPEGGVGRVRLWGGGPHVSMDTKATLDLWHSTYGVPIGRSIDALVAFARGKASFRILVKKKRNAPPSPSSPS
jgi:hypothetical protein